MILYLSTIQAFRQMRALVSLVVMSRDRAGIASCRCCFVQLNLSRARERAREASLPLTCRAARQIICTHTYFYVLALCCMYVPLERATYVPLERGYVRIEKIKYYLGFVVRRVQAYPNFPPKKLSVRPSVRLSVCPKSHVCFFSVLSTQLWITDEA